MLEGGSNEDSSGDKQNEERKTRENISEIKNELSEKINKSTSLGQAEGRERRHKRSKSELRLGTLTPTLQKQSTLSAGTMSKGVPTDWTI